MGNRTEELGEQARTGLNGWGLITNGRSEGDLETRIGCYARPRDKPTVLDPINKGKAKEQAKCAVNGFPQDFTG